MNKIKLRYLFLYALMIAFIAPIRAGIQTDKYLFDGGYVRSNATTGNFSFFYYNKDHLGNNREVLDHRGAVRQVTSYYPFGAPYADDAAISGTGIQPYKYNGKELDLMHGLNTYDYGARQYYSILGRWDRVDPLCERYYSTSPYVYCENDPVNAIDPDGRKTYLYATTLPGISHNKLTNIPTHTFLVIKDNDNNVKGYYAYGPKGNGSILGPLVKRSYDQDLEIITGVDNSNIKNVILIDTPDGMTDEQFDQKVIDVAESFGNNDKIMYSIFPNGDTQGNCNTSTSTILLKAGVSEDKIDKLKEQIPGISTGFGPTAKPWTLEEQSRALQTKDFMDWSESLLKTK